MKAMILVERVGKQQYRASTAKPIALTAEGRTRQQAVRRLRELLRTRLARADVLQTSVPGKPESNPWLAFAGIWRDHPDFNAFRRRIAEYQNVPGIQLEDWSK